MSTALYTIDNETWRSPNFDDRTKPISSLVIHSCEGGLPIPRLTSLPWLCDPKSKVSTHYYICRDTTIYQLVDDEYAAWHAGAALPPFVNNVSLGIELEHHAGQNWPDAQKDALAWLIRTLADRYQIPALWIETHGQVAVPGPYKRKIDPTNWPHGEFLLFVGNALAGPVTRIMHAGPYGAIARQDYHALGKAAAYYQPGQPVDVDEFHTNGYRHAASGIGFIADGDLVP